MKNKPTQESIEEQKKKLLQNLLDNGLDLATAKAFVTSNKQAKTGTDSK